MKNYSFLIALLALSSTVACDQTSDDELSPVGVRAGASGESGYADEDVSDWAPSYTAEDFETLPEDLQSSVLSACSSERQVVQVIEGTGCPKPKKGDWDRTPLIDDYCVYSYTGTGVAPSLEGDPAFGSVNDDCVVIRPQRGSALEPVIGEDVRNAFGRRLDVLTESDLEMNGNSTEQFRSPITVTVVDTVPRDRPLDPNAEHGEDLARIVQTIACPNTSAPDCAVSVEAELGLPRVDHDSKPDLDHGGYMGTFTVLATGIVDAVD